MLGACATQSVTEPPVRTTLPSAAINEAAKAIGLQQAMFVIPAFSVGLALVLLAGSRTIARDMAARDRQLAGGGVRP